MKALFLVEYTYEYKYRNILFIKFAVNQIIQGTLILTWKKLVVPDFMFLVKGWTENPYQVGVRPNIMLYIFQEFQGRA